MPRRCPTLTNPNVSIRLARNAEEVRRANRLVFRNYVECGYWRDDEIELARNQYLRLPSRHVMVVVDGREIIGTLSLILDSCLGMPADSFQSGAIEALRRDGAALAEISAFAFAKDHPHQHTLLHFLMAFLARYSYYYAAVDRLVAVCTPKHARFYELYYGFERAHTSARYDYVGVEAQMLTLELAPAFAAAHARAVPGLRDSAFQRFLYRDEHALLEFPAPARNARPRAPRPGAAVARQYALAV